MEMILCLRADTIPPCAWNFGVETSSDLHDL